MMQDNASHTTLDMNLQYPVHPKTVEAGFILEYTSCNSIVSQHIELQSSKLSKKFEKAVIISSEPHAVLVHIQKVGMTL
jgi:hypothetical protein